jgi:hypothetical protein
VVWPRCGSGMAGGRVADFFELYVPNLRTLSDISAGGHFLGTVWVRVGCAASARVTGGVREDGSGNVRA